MSCETKGWSKCHCCGGNVAVKANRSGKAYYRCDHCGVQVQHHWQRSSDKLLEQFAAAPEKTAAPAAKPAPELPKKKTDTVAAMLGLGA